MHDAPVHSRMHSATTAHKIYSCKHLEQVVPWPHFTSTLLSFSTCLPFPLVLPTNYVCFFQIDLTLWTDLDHWFWKEGTQSCVTVYHEQYACVEMNKERREKTVNAERSRRVNKERGEVQRGRTGEERQEEKSESESTWMPNAAAEWHFIGICQLNSDWPDIANPSRCSALTDECVTVSCGRKRGGGLRLPWPADPG